MPGAALGLRGFGQNTEQLSLGLSGVGATSAPGKPRAGHPPGRSPVSPALGVWLAEDGGEVETLPWEVQGKGDSVTPVWVLLSASAALLAARQGQMALQGKGGMLWGCSRGNPGMGAQRRPSCPYLHLV